MRQKIIRLAVPILLIVAMVLLLLKVEFFITTFSAQMVVGLILFACFISVIEAIQVFAFEKIDSEFNSKEFERKIVIFNKKNERGIYGIDDEGKICFIHYQHKNIITMGSVWECLVTEDRGTYYFVEPNKEL